jgi:hypothetical protein
MIIRSNSYNVFIKLMTSNIIIILALFMLTSCAKPKGQFAFRYPMDDRFKRIEGIPEFKRDLKVDWCFVFQKDYGSRDITVTVMKKEIIWVEVHVISESIDNLKRVIYGSIQDLSEGTYKLLITERDEIIAEKEFIIYSDNEGE